MKTVTITKSDFDRAISQPWSTETCLIAQTAKRNNMSDTMYDIANASNKADEAMATFDAHSRIIGTPEAKNNPVLKKLRASLPIKVTIFKD